MWVSPVEAQRHIKLFLLGYIIRHKSYNRCHVQDRFSGVSSPAMENPRRPHLPQLWSALKSGTGLPLGRFRLTCLLSRSWSWRAVP